MRFENWDVLLFPDSSRVPIQEFKTNCFVTRDIDSPYLQAQALLNPASLYSQNHGPGSPGQIPVLTSFIPSLSYNSAFRVSVHSWERPKPTRVMEGLMNPEDSVMYEVRIFVDGVCMSASLFNQRAPWPHVVDLSSQLDKNGNQDNLRFPSFHEELLHHPHWDAAESYGRIRVVIAEGFARPNRSPPFERVRDLIAFSYQHAPLHVLECSNIAWPNPGMWQPPTKQMLKYNLSHDLSGIKDEDTHSHSPTRHDVRNAAPRNYQTGLNFTDLPYRLHGPSSTTWQYNGWPGHEGPWMAPAPPIADPFVEPSRYFGPSRRSRSTLDDVSMPDYVGSSSNSSRAISNMTGLSFGRNKEPIKAAPINDEQYNQLIDAFSPNKGGGTCAPVNTPTSATISKPSSLQPTLAIDTTNQPGALKELSQPGSRARSGSSVRSRNSLNEAPPHSGTLLSPNTNVVSRKEGLVICEDKENSVEGGSVSPIPSPSRKNSSSSLKDGSRASSNVLASGESKRKRSVSSTREGTKRENQQNLDSPSPSKKVSRHGGNEQLSPAAPDDFLEESPRADLAGGGISVQTE